MRPVHSPRLLLLLPLLLVGSCGGTGAGDARDASADSHQDSSSWDASADSHQDSSAGDASDAGPRSCRELRDALAKALSTVDRRCSTAADCVVVGQWGAGCSCRFHPGWGLNQAAYAKVAGMFAAQIDAAKLECERSGDLVGICDADRATLICEQGQCLAMPFDRLCWPRPDMARRD